MKFAPGETVDVNGNIVRNGSTSDIDIDVKFRASNCIVMIGAECNVDKSLFIFNASESRVCIGSHVKMLATFELGIRSSILIGSNTTNTRHTYLSAAEGTSIAIGEDCMLSSDNEIRADDSHPIFNLENGGRVNCSRSIAIGNHVWIAKRAVVLSGSEIGDGSVIGFGSVVKGVIPNHSIASGNPARVLKSGIKWTRDHVSKHAPFIYETISNTKG